jgi:hypothetical protein
VGHLNAGTPTANDFNKKLIKVILALLKKPPSMEYPTGSSLKPVATHG